MLAFHLPKLKFELFTSFKQTHVHLDLTMGGCVLRGKQLKQSFSFVLWMQTIYKTTYKTIYKMGI